MIENSGLDLHKILIDMNDRKYPFGVDVIDGQVKDMIEAGIIDPLKVNRSALENAVSVGLMICTTDTIISDFPEKT